MKLFQIIKNFILGIFLGKAVIKRNDEAYDCLINFIAKQNNLFGRSRNVEILSNSPRRVLRKSLFSSNSDGNFRYVPARNEMVCFKFEGVFFLATRKDLGEFTSSYPHSIQKEIKLIYLAFTSKPLKRLLLKAKNAYKREHKPALTIKHLDSHDGEWNDLTEIDKRSMESLFLPLGLKEEILNDAKDFISRETHDFFKERNIPYRRGYLFYGEPGSGKSSLCHALASAIDRSIYVMNLAENSLSDHQFIRLMNGIPAGCIVLMEDIDAAFVKRDDATSNGLGLNNVEGNKPRGGGGGISFSTLLNAIDGIGAAEGRLLCLTTNYIDKLDNALIRPGRIDLRIKFEKATQEQCKQLFLHWYLPKKSKDNKIITKEENTKSNSVEKANEIVSINNDEKLKEDQNAASNHLIEDEIAKVQQMAQAFSQKITPDTVSVAAIQGFLITCGKDYNKVLQGVEDWLAVQTSQQQPQKTVKIIDRSHPPHRGKNLARRSRPGDSDEGVGIVLSDASLSD